MLNMGRAPCCLKVGLHRGSWTAREDKLLIQYINSHGEGRWSSLPKNAGLLRCGKSCRLRRMNNLRPDIKRGNVTPDEELILRLHALLDNRGVSSPEDFPVEQTMRSRTTGILISAGDAKTLPLVKEPRNKVAPENEHQNHKVFHLSPRKMTEVILSADDGRVEEEDTTITKIHIPKAIRVLCSQPESRHFILDRGIKTKNKNMVGKTPFVRFLIFTFSGLIRLAKMIGKTRFVIVLKIITWPAKILKLLQQELQL